MNRIKFESLSARKGSEKPEGLHSDHRGIPQARSSEGGNGGKVLDVTIQSREPVGSNTASVGRASLEQIHAKDVDPAPSSLHASDKSAERDLERRSERRPPSYSNIEPNTGLRRHGPI